MTMDIDIEMLRGWIGRHETKTEPVTAALVDRFRATFDQHGDALEGDVAPVMIHLCLAPPTAPTTGLGPDGHPTRGGFLPPVPLPRRMWAGGAFTFKGEIRVGDVVTRRSTILDVRLKEGRSGRLCFVTVEHDITANGRKVLMERQDIVYRDIDTPGMRKATPEAAPTGRHRMTVVPSTARLFRYSALTFNGHRIHYDTPYSREVESYPGLIVHGPMQATQLVQLAESVHGKPPAQFEFRSLSPIFDTSDYTLNAVEDGDGLRLWTATEGGPVAMEARATW